MSSRSVGIDYPKLNVVLSYLVQRIMEFKIHGILAPVFTPIHESGAINYDVIPEYLDYLVTNNINGILVGGTTGEAALLSLDERKKLLSAWVKEAKPHGVKVISQVGAAPLPDVLELAKFSSEVKADAIMTLPELYFKPKSVEQLLGYLELVAAAAPALPLVYYHFPMMSGVDVNMREFFAAAKSRIHQFKGMKADLPIAMQLADLLDPDQRIFIANHHLATAAFMGHESSIATINNLYPQLVARILADVKMGDIEGARALQEQINRLMNKLGAYGDFVPTMKAAMELQTGLQMGPPRKPLAPLSPQHIYALQIELSGAFNGALD